MIGRKPRIHVPCSCEKLLPKWPKYQILKNAHTKLKTAQEYFCISAKDLPTLVPRDKVRMKLDHEKRWEKEGTIVTGNPEHKWYIVKTNYGT